VSPERGDESFWADVLRAQGVGEDEIAEARSEGPLELFAVERYILEEPLRYDLATAAETSGIPEAELRTFWRALGFPDPEPGERTFTQRDVDMMRTVLQFIDAELVDETVAMQMARVIGSSLARVATAQVEVADLRGGGIAVADTASMTEEERALEVQRAAELIPVLSGVIESVWRRHLASAARARILQDDEAPEQPVTVGFADLEGFTSLSQQLPEHELAELVNHFEAVAYDVVARFPRSRVVKMIGDEVMFASDDVHEGADLALALAQAYGDDEALGDVRVGLATGRALKLEGDLYGPAVNMASRIVSIAYPGSVVVSPEVHDALDGDPHYRFRALRPHHLRHIGRTRLWRLHRSADSAVEHGDTAEVDEVGEEQEGESRTLRRARERRAARRAWIAERMADKLADFAAETAGDVTDRAVRRIIGGAPADGEADEPGGDESADPEIDEGLHEGKGGGGDGAAEGVAHEDVDGAGAEVDAAEGEKKDRHRPRRRDRE
jgi:adenylate cyclase